MRVVFPSDGSEFAPLPSPLGEQGRRSDRARVFRVRVRVSRACACTISIADNGTAALFETSSFRAIDSRPSDSNRRRGQREREEKEKNTNAKFTRRWRVRFCCDSVTHYSRVSFFLFFQPNLTNSSMFDRTNNKRTKRERERYSSFIFFSVVFPPCRRTVGNLHANKEQRGVTGYNRRDSNLPLLPPSPEYPVKEFTKTISLSTKTKADPDFRILLLLFHLSLKVT